MSTQGGGPPSGESSPHQPSGTDLPTLDSFVRTVLRSGLLTQEQLETSMREMSQRSGGWMPDNPQDIADHLVRTGCLSRFQARKILKKQGKGLILGPFQILAPIGRGGMGTVYLARDSRYSSPPQASPGRHGAQETQPPRTTSLGQLVALKVLPPQQARAHERLLARFQREMELSRLVQHPHLARTYEVGVLHEVHFLAMEYIPGQNLSRLVANSGPLFVPRAARLMAEVALAVEAIHQHGLIHRDLKPGNILVTPNDHAKVLDLGLALVVAEKETDITVVGGQGYIVGTMDYISPEQSIDPTQVDSRSDVYALGCTLYFALAGQPPFPGGSSREKIQRQRQEEPTPLGQLRPAVPAPFAAIVHRMMAKDPDQRYATAKEVEAALLPWADTSGKPLEGPGDPTYTAAVRSLESEDTSTEYSEDWVDSSSVGVPLGKKEGSPQDSDFGSLIRRPGSEEMLEPSVRFPGTASGERSSLRPDQGMGKWLGCLLLFVLGVGLLVLGVLVTVALVISVLRW